MISKTNVIRLSPDFAFAETSDERVSFTRSERRVLAALAGQPGRLFTRDLLLDAVGETGSDRGDRTIDFLINRLRAKLKDDARNPRYIATRYGEGYVWVGQNASVDTGCADAYLVVGPLRGLGNIAGNGAAAERFASDLCSALGSELAPGQKVVLAPDCPPVSAFANEMPSLSAELSFFEEGGTVNGVATVREFRTGRILAVHRIALPGSGPAGAMRATAIFASTLLDQTWRSLASQTDAGGPLPVLMHLAAAKPEQDYGSLADSDRRLHQLALVHADQSIAAWTESDARLKNLLKASPDDAALKILCATHLHSKYVLLGYGLFQAGIDDRIRDEDEIETLVLDALPQVQSQPEYAIMAAKLLHFVDRCYFDLARELSERAYASSVSGASSLSVIAQLRAFGGDTEAALRCIEQALNLIAPGTKAHLYALTIKMQILRATADFERLNAAKHELYRVSAAAIFFYEPMFADPDRLSLRAKAAMLMLTREKAAALLRYNNYISARLFRDPAHRANAILTPLTLFVRRFGTASVPEEIAAMYRGLLARFPDPAQASG